MSSVAPLSLARRKAWAMRRGNPLWLWPEIAPRDWRAAMLAAESACAAILAGRRPDALDGEPAALGLAGYTSGVGPLLGWWLERGLLSASCADVDRCLRHQLGANRQRMAKLLDRANEIAGLLAEAKISVTLLKGSHTAWAYFPHPACRPMSDIDVLIARADAARAAALLAEAGYLRIAGTELETTWQHREAAGEPLTSVSLEADDPWTLDLHVSLDVPGPPGAEPARLSELDCGLRCRAGEPFSRAWRLTQPALLLHLAAHAGSGFHNLTLLRLVEVALVARADRASGALDWREWVETGQATGSLGFAYPALDLARRLAPDAIPQDVVARCAAEAPLAIRRIVAKMRPATAHRIDRPSLRGHFAWTRGPGGWLRRLAADVVPEPRSWRRTAEIHAARAIGLLRAGSPD